MKVVLDIETVQIPKQDWARLVGVPVIWPEDLLEAGEAAQQDRDYEKSAFDGTFAQIVCIGLITFSDAMEPKGAVCWYGGTSQHFCATFGSDWLSSGRPSSSRTMG